MTMTVLNLQNAPREINYFSAGFRNIVENHLQILRNTAKTESIAVAGKDEVKHRGDFYGLMHEMNIDRNFHWIALRLNDLHSPMDYDGKLLSVLLPDENRVEFMLARWMNSQSYV